MINSDLEVLSGIVDSKILKITLDACRITFSKKHVFIVAPASCCLKKISLMESGVDRLNSTQKRLSCVTLDRRLCDEQRTALKIKRNEISSEKLLIWSPC